MERGREDYSKSAESERELAEIIRLQEYVNKEGHRLLTSGPEPLEVMLPQVSQWLFRGYWKIT